MEKADSTSRKLAIIGGGAAGFFGAIQAAQTARNRGIEADIKIFEASPAFLSKVRISGGGRCNVTHHQFDPSLFAQNYPRGKRELRSPFSRFQASDTVEWFKRRGIQLVAEADGRMFPSSNKSETIIECFMREALDLGVELKTKSPVAAMARESDGAFNLSFRDGSGYRAHKVLIATGSSKTGHALARGLGHTITELAPSLFTFKAKHPVLDGLAGTSFPAAKLLLRLPEKKFAQEGPLLITHRGLSGPAILKLSAWAAREMKRADYRATLLVNWTGAANREAVEETLRQHASSRPKALVKNAPAPGFTNRFWQTFIAFNQISQERVWGEISKKEFNRLVDAAFSLPIEIQGQNRFKEEFVECGGIKTSEVDFKTMESRVCPGLYFAGETLDIDGITGGFNFQNAWTTAYIAGHSMGES